MRGHKFRSGVNWEGALEQKDIKQGPGIARNVLLLSDIAQNISIEVMVQVVT